MSGLDDAELQQQTGEALPVREQMSLMSTGGLGLVDAGATGTGTETGGGDVLGGTSGDANTDPNASASTADPYTSTASDYSDDAGDHLAAATPDGNDGEYSPQESATATG